MLVYKARFKDQEIYRRRVWAVTNKKYFIASGFHQTGTVLELGCRYCEFINQAKSAAKFAMDLNLPKRSQAGRCRRVQVLEQDCSLTLVHPRGQTDHGVYQQFFGTSPDQGACRGDLAACV